MTRFQRRLELALQLNGMKAVDLCNKTGLSSGTISQYRSGRCKPKMERVKMIAEVLNVSPSWLLGYDGPMQPSTTDANLLFLELTPEDQLKAIDYMRYLRSKEYTDVQG